MSEDMDKVTHQYILVRDELKRRQKAFDEDKERLELLSIQEKLSGKLQAFLDANKLDNCKTPHGTFHRTTRYTASLADPDIFMRYVRETNKFELLDRRANATAVRDYVKENNQLPPGCNLTAIQNIGVKRRPGSGSTPEGAEE